MALLPNLKVNVSETAIKIIVIILFPLSFIYQLVGDFAQLKPVTHDRHKLVLAFNTSVT